MKASDIFNIKAMLLLKAQREEDIIKITCVFPSDTYKASPTPEQIEQLVERAEKIGLTAQALYYLFCENAIPPLLDTLIKELVMGWRPAGEIVESDEVRPPAPRVDPHEEWR